MLLILDWTAVSILLRFLYVISSQVLEEQMAGEISEKMKMVHFQEPEMITHKIATAQSPEVTDCLLGKSPSLCIVATKVYRDQKEKEKTLF